MSEGSAENARCGNSLRCQPPQAGFQPGQIARESRIDDRIGRKTRYVAQDGIDIVGRDLTLAMGVEAEAGEDGGARIAANGEVSLPKRVIDQRAEIARVVGVAGQGQRTRRALAKG